MDFKIKNQFIFDYPSALIIQKNSIHIFYTEVQKKKVNQFSGVASKLWSRT